MRSWIFVCYLTSAGGKKAVPSPYEPSLPLRDLDANKGLVSGAKRMTQALRQ